MSTPITFNNISYSVPAYNDTGYAQGSGNLSSYLIAISTGTLQQSGGTFSLTADVNFGLNFGLLSKYFKSISAGIATAGVVRLANSDTIDWRNFLGNGNLALSVNSADQLVWDGQVVTTGSAAAVQSITGTANQIFADVPAGNVTLSLPQDIALVSSPSFASETLTNTTNQLVLGTTRTVTVTAPTPASASRTVTLPDLSANYSVVGTEGTQTINGNKTLSGTTNLSTLSASLPLQLDVSKNITSTAIDLSTSQVTSTLPVSHGGTGNTTFTAYSIIAAGTTATGAFQNVSGVGSSGQVLTSNGPALLPTWQNAAGTGTVNSGTSGHLTYYASSSNVVSSDAGLTTDGAGTLTGANLVATSNVKVRSGGQLQLFNTLNTNAAELQSPTLAADRAYTFPDAGANADVVLTEGTQTINGTKTFGNAIAGQTTFSNGIAISGVTSTNYITASSSSASAISSNLINTNNANVAADMSFLLRTGGSSAGDPYLTFNISSVTNWSLGIDNSVSDTFTINAAATLNASSSPFTISTAGVVTLGSQGIIHGTTTNDSASAGFVGEYIESKNASNTNFPSSGQYGDAGNISLTAGDWDVTFQIVADRNTATWTRADAGISTTTGNSSTGLSAGDNLMIGIWGSSATTPADMPITVATYRMSLSATTTVYGKVQAVYSGGQPQYTYRLSARRVR